MSDWVKIIKEDRRLRCEIVRESGASEWASVYAPWVDEEVTKRREAGSDA